MNEKLSLALDEFLHVGVGLVIIIALVSVVTGLIRAFVPLEKLQKRLSKTGKFKPYSYLLTKIKSPIFSVGIIDPEGILKGSKINDLITKTIKITGKKPAVYSSHIGLIAFSLLFLK